MITSQQASDLVRNFSAQYLYKNSEIIPTPQSLGRILAVDIHAQLDQPPFDRVAMDGIAINFESLSNSKEFEIEDLQKAGGPRKKLFNKKNCLEVMTGAPLPEGCDTIIPYEMLSLNEGKATITNLQNLNQFQHIHQQGSDFKKDALLIPKTKFISSGNISIIASSGLAELKVRQLPQMTIVSTGDELIEPGSPLLPHQIYRSNPYALNAILKDFGFHSAKLIHLRDKKEEMLLELNKVLNQDQILVISGGVSKGKFDFIPDVLNELGVKKIFHTVNQRPGKPLYFGTGPKGQLIFGVPGNPVSAMVNLRRYVIPAILQNFKPTMYVKLTQVIQKKNEMTLFIPAKLNFSPSAMMLASPLSNNGSGDFFSLRDSEGFIEIDQLNPDNIYPFYHWKNIGGMDA